MSCRAVVPPPRFWSCRSLGITPGGGGCRPAKGPPGDTLPGFSAEHTWEKNPEKVEAVLLIVNDRRHRSIQGSVLS
jgi:hypothetical protein